MAGNKQGTEEPTQDAITLSKCRDLFKRVMEIEEEQDNLKDRAKDCGNRADALRSEIQQLITNPRQLSMSVVAGEADAAPAPR